MEHRGGGRISVEKHIVSRGTVPMRECPAQNPSFQAVHAQSLSRSRLNLIGCSRAPVWTCLALPCFTWNMLFSAAGCSTWNATQLLLDPNWFHVKVWWKGIRAAIRDYASIVGPPTFRSFFAPTSKYLRNECGMAIGSRQSHCADLRTSSRSRPPIHRMTLSAET